jgi:signal peptidase II
MLRKWTLFAVVVVIAVGIDAWTKRLAETHLQPGVTQEALGGLVRLTLGHNRGIAFGLHLGEASRVVFTAVALAILPVVAFLYGTTPARLRLRRFALPLMFAGALGNVIDRLTNPRGVVDFLGPYDLGFMTWPVFNLADVFVVVGTLAFAMSVGTIERAAHAPSSSEGAPAPVSAPAAAPPPPGGNAPPPQP